ncbi:shikimate dehydrogenase [Flavobacteriaceae bacterium UJ101]|nr:shikimate dehydrogenase [Flavobacteriaceae bacterium UJ101]
MNTYGLIGKNISYSFSENYFSEKFKRESISNTVYKNFDLQDISEFSQLLQNTTLKGLNVTIPYKELIIPFLDQLSPEAEKIKAVNVIKFDDGKLIGHNSDIYGFEQSFKEKLKPHHQKALILGTGGASKAIQYALQKNNIAFQIVSRKSSLETITYNQLTQELLSEYLVIINCTPLGTFPKIDQKPSIPYQFLTNHHYLYDLVYNPTETLFMKEGLKRNASVKNGLKMLELQAEKAWEIWHSK